MDPDRLYNPRHPPDAQHLVGALTVGYMNCRGQTGLNLEKQKQIELFILKNKVHILNLQEININSDGFKLCPVISSGYQVISNNSPTKYGTAVLVQNDLEVSNLQFDAAGRVIVFNVCEATIMNCLA